MEYIIVIMGKVVLYAILGFGVIGMIGAIRDEEKGIGAEWSKGIAQVGLIFWSVGGFMTMLPYFQKLVSLIFTKFSAFFGVDPSVVASSMIVIDSGGYQLAKQLATSNETWILSWFSSAMLGCVMCFAIPIGLVMVKKKDYKYFGLGIMGGVLSTPFGVLFGGILMMIIQPPLRSVISTSAPSDMILHYNILMIFQNLLPLTFLCILIALGLRFFPDAMIKGFLVFGKVLATVLRVCFMMAIIEFYTGIFSQLFGNAWLFQPIIADKAESIRALEICGMVGMMLAGAYPMIYLMNKYLSKQLIAFGRVLGFAPVGASAVVGTLFNEMAMFGLFSKMTPRDKVRALAFSNCAAFILADQLTFTLNFQPNIYIIFLIAKLAGGICALLIVDLLLVKLIDRFEAEDRVAGIIDEREFLDLQLELQSKENMIST